MTRNGQVLQNRGIRKQNVEIDPSPSLIRSYHYEYRPLDPKFDLQGSKSNGESSRQVWFDIVK